MLSRFIFRLTALISLLYPVQVAMTANGQPVVSASDVRVERSGEHFTMDLTLYAPVPPSVAWEVLTDFEHMTEFAPDLISSQVLERSETVIKVIQKGVIRYGLFSTNFESKWEIRLNPLREIDGHGVGNYIQHMESVMQLQAEGTGTRLVYHAEIAPGFWFPPFIGPALVRYETAIQFSALIQEMTRRQ